MKRAIFASAITATLLGSLWWIVAFLNSRRQRELQRQLLGGQEDRKSVV